MDDESIRQHLHINILNNSISSTNGKRRLSALVILTLACVVTVCVVTFAVIALQRGADIENRVNSHETQLQLVKKLSEKILRTKSNRSSTSRALNPQSSARKHVSPFRSTWKKVQYLIFSGSV